MIRAKNETKSSLLSATENCETLIHQTHINHKKHSN